MIHADVIIIGAGMAGASAAAELAAQRSVIVLEAEGQPGYHSTGRSAAMFAPGYGPAPVRALSRASGPFLSAPPDGFADHPILTPRGELIIARADQADVFDAAWEDLRHDAAVSLLDAAAVRERVPLLRDGYAAHGILDETGCDIDVHALHQGYLRRAKAQGVAVQCNAGVTAMTRQAGVWQVSTRSGDFSAPVVINAAGAWADRIGAMAGAEPLGLQPKRRTALIVAAPDGMRCDTYPLVVDVDEQFYLKPDAGRLLISPANEDPTDPCDVQPDEMDMALCIDRIQQAFDLPVRRIENRWAGLRSFVADKCPVVGWSGVADGFFWLAGQGGYGIQMAPALARLTAAWVQGLPMPADLQAQGVRENHITPKRFPVKV